MAEQFLNDAQIRTPAQKMRGKGMTKCMVRSSLRQTQIRSKALYKKLHNPGIEPAAFYSDE